MGAIVGSRHLKKRKGGEKTSQLYLGETAGGKLSPPCEAVEVHLTGNGCSSSWGDKCPMLCLKGVYRLMPFQLPWWCSTQAS